MDRLRVFRNGAEIGLIRPSNTHPEIKIIRRNTTSRNRCTDSVTSLQRWLLIIITIHPAALLINMNDKSSGHELDLSSQEGTSLSRRHPAEDVNDGNPVTKRRRRVFSCESCQRLKCKCDYDFNLQSCLRCQTLRSIQLLSQCPWLGTSSKLDTELTIDVK